MLALARRGSPLPTTQSSTSPYTGEERGIKNAGVDLAFFCMIKYFTLFENLCLHK